MPARRSASVICYASSYVSHSQRTAFHVYSCGPAVFVARIESVRHWFRSSGAEYAGCNVVRRTRWRISRRERRLGLFSLRRLKRLDGFRIFRIAHSAAAHLLPQRLLCSFGEISVVAGEFEQFSVVFLAVLRGESLPLLNGIDLHGQKYTAIPKHVRAFQGLRAPLPRTGATIQSNRCRPT